MINMAYYNICPNCGARLDPGESCDCEDKEKAASGLAPQIAAKNNIQYQYIVHGMSSQISYLRRDARE